MERDKVIEYLVSDYEDYLEDFTNEELALIKNSSYFTYRDAKITEVRR